jgi:hypothetical protein
MIEKRLHLFPHMGLGDQIISRGIVRHFASQYQYVTLMCFAKHEGSVRWLHRDLVNVSYHATDYYAGSWVMDHVGRIKNEGKDDHLFLGSIREDWEKFSSLKFDERFYAQVGLPFSLRWTSFHNHRSTGEIELFQRLSPGVPFALVHDDPDRDIRIPCRDRIGLPVVNVTPETDNIFDWRLLAEGANEIHCTDSSFLNLIESIPPVRAKLYYHLYAKRDMYSRHGVSPYSPPTTRKDWIVLGAPIK